ncbi:hypothetical protein CRM22_011028, partial [Opisthorchis felineus]
VLVSLLQSTVAEYPMIKYPEFKLARFRERPRSIRFRPRGADLYNLKHCPAYLDFP